jgi:hypothetical protein
MHSQIFFINVSTVPDSQECASFCAKKAGQQVRVAFMEFAFRIGASSVSYKEKMRFSSESSCIPLSLADNADSAG